MKKGLIIALAVLMALGLTTMGMAAPTTVDTFWSGFSGTFNTQFVAGDDANSNFWTGAGGLFNGEFHGVDNNDNPYGYNVDTVSSFVRASVIGGGFITFDMSRNDSFTPMYGQAGQYSFSEVSTFDGSASLARHTGSNYAGMKNCNYGWQANNQYTAQGSSFYIDHYIKDGDGEGAGVWVAGNGSASVTSMSDEMYASSFRLGRGCGCYDNANAFGTGSGTFELYATASNSLSGNGWSSGGGSYLQQINYVSGFTANNTYVDGN